MFTGIIKELGKVRNISGLGGLYKLSVESKDIVNGAAIGDSIAVNGICLTVTQKDKNALSFDVMGETLKRTNLSKLRYGDAVNLEDALKVGSSLSGHFVTGHIDCIGKVEDIIKPNADEISVEISFPDKFNIFAVEKGSIAIDGISLTIGRISKKGIVVYIIPHTLKMTTLGFKRIGDGVNLEFDMIGKYIRRRIE